MPEVICALRETSIRTDESAISSVEFLPSLIAAEREKRSEQQHNQDLRRIHYIEEGMTSRIHHFLPECIAPRTTQGSTSRRRPLARGF